LIGVNDVWHEVVRQNGVELDRFEKVYRMLLEDTLKVLPNIKIMLLEPYILPGTATEEHYDEFVEVYKYAEVVKKLTEEYDLYFLPLQELFTQKAKEFGADQYANDGVHPLIPGATLIADEWVKLFREKIEK
jgi:lysophospholipase L1-like esterase